MFALETVPVKNQTLSATQPREETRVRWGKDAGSHRYLVREGQGPIHKPHHDKLSTQHANSIPGERLRAQPP